MKMNLKVQVALHLIGTGVALSYVIHVPNSALISQYIYMQHWIDNLKNSCVGEGRKSTSGGGDLSNYGG